MQYLAENIDLANYCSFGFDPKVCYIAPVADAIVLEIGIVR